MNYKNKSGKGHVEGWWVFLNQGFSRILYLENEKVIIMTFWEKAWIADKNQPSQRLP